MATNDSGNEIWVQCSCLKWRKLCVNDPSEVTQNWTCDMNPDEQYNACDKLEEPFEEDDDDLFCNYVCGSLVRAKIAGYPWWPAVVAEDPESENGEFARCKLNNKEVTDYHVVFLGKTTTRCWIKKDSIKPFDVLPPTSLESSSSKNRKKWNRKDLKLAEAMGVDAHQLSLAERLEKHVQWMRSIDNCASDAASPNTANIDEHLSKVPKSEKKKRALKPKQQGFAQYDTSIHSTAVPGDELLNSGDNVTESPESKHFAEAFKVKPKPSKKSIKRQTKTTNTTDVSSNNASMQSTDKKKVVKSLFKPVGHAEGTITSKQQGKSSKSLVTAASSNSNVTSASDMHNEPGTPLATELPAEHCSGTALESSSDIPASPSNIKTSVTCEKCTSEAGQGITLCNVDDILDAVARGEFNQGNVEQDVHAETSVLDIEKVPVDTVVAQEQETFAGLVTPQQSFVENDAISVVKNQFVECASAGCEVEQASAVLAGEEAPSLNEICVQDSIPLTAVDSVLAAVARGEFTVNPFVYLYEVELTKRETGEMENGKIKPSKKATLKSARSKVPTAVIQPSSHTVDVEILPETQAVNKSAQPGVKKASVTKKRQKPANSTSAGEGPAVKKIKKFVAVTKSEDSASISCTANLTSSASETKTPATDETKTNKSGDQAEVKEAEKIAVVPLKQYSSKTVVKKFTCKKAFVRPAVVPNQNIDKDKVTPVQSSNENSCDEQRSMSSTEELGADQTAPMVIDIELGTDGNTKSFPVGLMSAASAISNDELRGLNFVTNSSNATDHKEEPQTSKPRFPLRFISAAAASSVSSDDKSCSHYPTFNTSMADHEVEALAKPKFPLTFVPATSIQIEPKYDVHNQHSVERNQPPSEDKMKLAFTVMSARDVMISLDQAVEDGEALGTVLCHGSDLDLHNDPYTFGQIKAGSMLIPEREHECSDESPLHLTEDTVDLNKDIIAWND